MNLQKQQVSLYSMSFLMYYMRSSPNHLISYCWNSVYSIIFRFKTTLSKIATLLKEDGMLILRDYHPVYTKLLGVDHPSFRANGNYFDEELIEEDVAYSILLTEAQKESLPKTTIRRWTLGEIITTLAGNILKLKN